MAVNSGSSVTQNGKKWSQILAIIVAAISSLSTGILYAWSSPSILQIEKDNHTYHITEEETSYFPILPPIGMIVGAVFFNRLTDIIGRKHTLLLVSIPHLICWILIYTSTNAALFFVSRVIAGIGDAALFASMPVYVGEIATPQVRGFWGNFSTFCHFGGQFAITVIGSYFSVRTTALICAGLPVIFTILFTQMPESPYYLIQKRRFEDARVALKWLRRKDDIQKEFDELRKDVERQISESGKWKDLVSIGSNRRALLAGIFLRFSQQLGGIASFATNTQPIFEKAGGDFSPQISSIIFVGLCFVLNFFGSAIVAKFGRRKAYVYSTLGCGSVLLGLSVYFVLDHFKVVDLSTVGMIPLVGMVVYIIFFSFGMGVVPTLMLSELFSASIKGKGLCVMSIVFSVAAFVGNYLFKILNTYIGLYAPFFLFSMTCLISSVLTLYFVPETKGKTLEEIQQSLKMKSSKNIPVRS